MNKLQAKRESLLNQMGEIDTMHRGRLSEEYRERHENGQTVRLGPYYKYQEWVDGRNKSRRVKADEVEALREGISGMDTFKQLAADYIDTTVQLTEQRDNQSADSKKNSR
jgi:hypothetical protein